MRTCEDCCEESEMVIEVNDPQAKAEGRDAPVDLCEDCFTAREDDAYYGAQQ